MRLAVTGGSGFVGAHLLDAAVAAGHQVTALTRRPQPDRAGVSWIAGSLSDAAALAALTDRADALIHVAGVISAPTAAEFDAGNVAGTASLLQAATAAGVRRFVHVSSLAAREPDISMYGASKARSEELVRDSALDWAIVRPPAVYGPGDRETLELFKMAKTGLMLLPPDGRLSLIHVRDLVALLLALAAKGAPSKCIIEPDDGRPGGWSHKAFGEALGQSLGRRTIRLATPAPLLRGAARLDRLFRRDKAKLTPDRAAYFCHPDWVVSAWYSAPPELWRPSIATEHGLAETAAWYRAQGWL